MKKMKKTGSKGKQNSTFDKEMRNAEFKKAFDKEYKEFARQEILTAVSQGDEKSVRALAKAAGLNPNAVQNLRSGKTNDIKLTSFVKIAKTYGYVLELVKGDVRIPVESEKTKMELAY